MMALSTSSCLRRLAELGDAARRSSSPLPSIRASRVGSLRVKRVCSSVGSAERSQSQLVTRAGLPKSVRK